MTEVIRREWLLFYRRGIASLYPVCFFTVVAILFPLSLSDAPQVLAKIGVGMIWVSALLACFLSLDSLLQNDYQYACLEQWFFTRYSLTLLISVKLLIHWFAVFAPLLLLTPVLAYSYGLGWEDCKILLLSLCIGTPILVMIGAIATALTLGVRQQGLLLALLCLPLYIPVLIFGTGSVATPSILYILLALLLLIISVGPLAMTAAVRLGIE